MSKPLVEPISTASLSPLTWVRKLFIPDAMTGYITEEELKKYQKEIDDTEKTGQKAVRRNAEDGKGVNLSEAPKKDSELENVFNRKTDHPEAYLAFSFKDLLKAAILKAYGFDGYNRTTNKYITAKGEEYDYKNHAFNKLLHIVGFFGFPNRPDNREVGKETLALGGEIKPTEYPKPYDFPKLGLPQFLLSFVGGWHRGRLANKTIKLVQIPASFFKVVIFAIKWATFPFKFALNLVKVITEVFPTLIADAAAQGIGYRVRQIDETNKSDEKNKGPYIAGHVILIGLLGLVYLPFKIAAIVGTAITSPAISAQLAFATGRSIKINNWPWATTALGVILGILGIALSIGLTIALWSVFIPLIVGGAMTFAPALVTPIVTWFLQLPLVGTTIGMVHGALVPLSSVIGAAFTPYITAITGLAVGLQIPAEAVALGATLAVLVAPSASALSFVAGKLSDYWALAGKYGMIGVFTKYYFPQYFSPKGYSSLNDENDEPGDGHEKGLGSTGTPQPASEGDVLLGQLGGGGTTSNQQQHQGSTSSKRRSGILRIVDGSDGGRQLEADDDNKFESEMLDQAELDDLTSDLNDMTPRSRTEALAQQRKSSVDSADDATITAANAGRGASVVQSNHPTNPTRTTSGGRGKDPTNPPRTGVGADNKIY